MSNNLEFFKTNGYLVKENLIDRSLIRKINKIVKEVISKEKRRNIKLMEPSLTIIIILYTTQIILKIKKF